MYVWNCSHCTRFKTSWASSVLSLWAYSLMFVRTMNTLQPFFRKWKSQMTRISMRTMPTWRGWRWTWIPGRGLLYETWESGKIPPSIFTISTPTGPTTTPSPGPCATIHSKFVNFLLLFAVVVNDMRISLLSLSEKGNPLSRKYKIYSYVNWPVCVKVAADWNFCESWEDLRGVVLQDVPGREAEAVKFAGENFIRYSGEVVGANEAQVFAWQARQKG